MRSKLAILSGLVVAISLGVSSEAEAKRHRRHYRHYGSGGRVVVVAPSQARVYYGGGYRYGYGHRRHGCYTNYSTYYGPAPVPVYTQPVYTQPTYTQPTYSQPTYTRRGYSQDPFVPVVEVGLRAVGGGTEGSFETVAGIGAYARARRGALGLEASIDSLAVTGTGGEAFGRVPVLGAGLLYLNPRSPVRLYGLVGGGLSFQQINGATSEALTLQAGAGLDIDLGSKVSLSLDARGISDAPDGQVRPLVGGASPLPAPSAYVTGNLGISVKF
jgi:hypothetical protein